jgi:hypothetical protein
VEFAVIILVADGDPDCLVEPPARGVQLGHPRLNLRRDVVFLAGADRYVQDLALDLRVPPGEGLHLALDFLDGAPRDVAGDQLAAEFPLALHFDRLVLTGRRLRAKEVFFPLGAVPILFWQPRLVECPQELLLAFEPRPLVEEVVERPAKASAFSYLRDRHSQPPVSCAGPIAAARKAAPRTPG